MKLLSFCVVALIASAPAFTQTRVPAAPSVTAGAEFKGLRLDWDPVAGAGYYQLEYRAHQTGAFVQQGVDYPASRTFANFRLPLHLFDWTYARYRVAACNSAGCTRSAEVSVSALRRQAVGVFKASGTPAGTGGGLGFDTDLSTNGLNFVAAAPNESQFDGTTWKPGGALYVFGRKSDGTWVQRARLVPTIPPFIEGSNEMHVAISGDGNTVALGMPNYFHEEFDYKSGDVFVFHFKGTAWTRTRLPAISRGLFGRWVSLNDAGDTLALARGENPDPPSSTPWATDIYKLVNGAWTPVRSIGVKPGGFEYCNDTGALSRDGSTVAEQCVEGPNNGNPLRVYVRTMSGPNWTYRDELPLELPVSTQYGYGHSGLGISGNGDVVAAQIYVGSGPNPDNGLPSEVHVFKRTASVYSKVAELAPGAWRTDAVKRFYGLNIAVSGDGGTIAVGDPWDNGLGNGPRAAPLNAGDVRTGAVYVFRFNNTWRLVNMIKPNSQQSIEAYGRELGLSGNGQTLIVGENSANVVWMY